MRRDGITSVGLCIALVGGFASVRADIVEPKDSAYYKVIVVRNVFGLKDPMPESKAEPTNPPVKVDVKFTGVTAHSGAKKAWFIIPPQPGKSKDPKYLSMAEGEKDGDLQVLEIDENGPTVKVLNAGVPVVLNFKEHGLAAPTALAVPGPSAAPALGVRSGAGNPAIIPPPAPAYVTPAGGAIPSASATDGTVAPNVRTIPSRNLRTTPINPAAQGASAAQPAVDPAVQYIQLKAQEQAARQKGVPYPPTPPLPGVPTE